MLGEVERASPPRSMGDGEDQPQGRLQAKEGLQEASENEKFWVSTPSHGICKARECAEASRVLGVPPGGVARA